MSIIRNIAAVVIAVLWLLSSTRCTGSLNTQATWESGNVSRTPPLPGIVAKTRSE